MKNYQNLLIWKKGMDIVEVVYRGTESFPTSETYGLKSQMRRAAVSIPSNIAEGCGRESKKEFKYFLQMALASSYELHTQHLLTQRLGLCTVDNFDQCNIMIIEEQKMITGLIKRIQDR